MKSPKTETAPTRSAKSWEQPELQQSQKIATQEAARQATIEHDRRNKLTISQRVGHIALGGVANSVILAHSTKVLAKGAGALLGKDIHTAIARRGEAVAPRLRERHEARQSAEVAPSRLRRLGNFAVKASLAATEAITRHSSKRAAHLDEKSTRLESEFTQKRGGGRLVDTARAYKENRAEEKSRVQSERHKAANEGMLKYREAHPEIAERERIEQEISARHDTLVSLWREREHSVDTFRGQRADSFLMGIPRRPSREGQPGFTGDYNELAKDTVSSALTYKSEDGTIPLLGGRLEHTRLAEHEKQGQSIYTARKAETDYIDGVCTSLWQLGFVQIEKEGDIPYGRGNFNPSIEWEMGSDSVKARLPYDPTNELHQLLIPAESAGTNQMIELEMPPKEWGNGSQQDQYLNIRTIQAVPAAVAA